MPNPWEGTLPRVNDSKSGNSKILNRIRVALNNSDDFIKADKLKMMIENPTAFENGRPWSRAEKEELKQAEMAYIDIQSEKNNIKNSLDEMDLLFNEKSQYSTKLSEDNRYVESRLKEIDEHLSQYEEILKLLNEKLSNKTEEEEAWELKAREQIKKLISEKNSLHGLLQEFVMLQNNLKHSAETIEEELEKLLTRGGSQPRGQACFSQSSGAINREMAEIRSNVCGFGESIKKVCESAASLFGKVFDAIKNSSSKIAEKLKSSSLTLEESSELLNSRPVALRQMRF